jgi:hypothetical protein
VNALEDRYWQEWGRTLFEGGYCHTRSEESFCRTMATWDREPTPKQKTWLDALIWRAHFEMFAREVEAENFEAAEEAAEWLFRRAALLKMGSDS